jgi:hypothetical protein
MSRKAAGLGHWGALAGMLLATGATQVSIAAASNVGKGPETTAKAGSFEGLLQGSEPAPKAEALVAPFAEDCGQARREIDRARCRGTQSFLRARLPGKTLHAVVDSARVVSVSAYDASVRGYRVRLLGCVTCDDPVVDSQGESRYVTLAVPAKNASSLREAVVLGETTVAVANPAAGRTFESEIKPRLRAEFLFRGDGTPWSHGGRKGVAFSPVGMRIFNRCTGDVIFSQPPSEKLVDVVDDLPGCAPAPVAATPPTGAAGAGPASPSVGRNKDGTPDAPEKLGASEIGTALRDTRAAVAACDAEYKKPGAVELEFDLSGAGGPPTAVRAKGVLGGTPVANCLLEAVRGVQFPRFQRSRQTFSYAVRLGNSLQR